MSIKKNNKVKQRLIEKQRLKKKKKMILEIKKEIQKLEYDIKHAKISNLKINMLRGLKISLRVGQLISPYIVSASITWGVFSALGTTPFITDEYKKSLERKEEINSFGNIKYEEQYDGFESAKGTITYVGMWNKQDDGFYSREIKTYSTENVEKDIIEKIINDIDINSLEDIFGNNVSYKKQIQNNLTDEEIQTQPYLEAIIYSTLDDDFIVVKEELVKNSFYTLLWIFVTILAEIATLFVRKEISSFDFKNCVKKIKEKHPLIDEEELVKKLEIKRDNYNMLMR